MSTTTAPAPTGYTYPSGFTTGERVAPRAHPNLVGTITYPGLTGIPGRVYVRFPGMTDHFHPDELARVTCWYVYLRDETSRDRRRRFTVAALAGDREAAVARARELFALDGGSAAAGLVSVEEVNAR